MATYSLYLLPASAFNFGTTGWGASKFPWNAYAGPTNQHSVDGSIWNNNGPWDDFSIDKSAAVKIDILDNDSKPGELDDDTYWAEGQGLQTIQTAYGPAAVGDNVVDEYEVKLLGSDGETYTLAAINVVPHGKTNAYDGTIIGYTFDGAWPAVGVTLSYVQNSNEDSGNLLASNMKAPCFSRGTLILTNRGEVAVEDLSEGDLVQTLDNGLRPIRWIGSRALDSVDLARSPEMLPIRISAGALGENTPAQDLLVSPQHRVLVRSRIAQRMFGTNEVLVAAKQLLQLDGIDIVAKSEAVEYFHILFDQHEVIISNGAATESLYTGPEAMNALGNQVRAEIFALFPELHDRNYVTMAARPLASGRMARKLAVRHAEMGKTLVS